MASNVLEKSVKAAEAGAKAAQDNIEIFINKERARLTVEMKPLVLKSESRVGRTVDYSVRIFGTTAAFVTETRCIAYVLPLNNAGDPEVGSAHMFPIYHVPKIIAPNSPPTDCFAFLFLGDTSDDASMLTEIRNDRLFIGIKGFIRYTDVFDREHGTNFRYVWRFSSMAAPSDSERLGSWERCGSQEDNKET